jgi:uncharacterized protein (DUF58 family)
VSRAGGIGLAGGGLILAAYVFGTSELLIPGLAFLVLAALAPPWIHLAARGASLTRSLDTESVLEEQPLEARLEVRRGPLGLPGAEIIDPLAGGTIEFATPGMGVRGARITDVRVIARFSRRGRRRLAPPVLRLRDPLGLVEVVRQSQSKAQALLVLPRTERPRPLRHDGGEQVDWQAGAAAVDITSAIEIDGLRPYRAGTPASRISWTALARGAGLLERRLKAERDSGPLVVLDVRCEEDGPRVDAAVRAAASLSLDLARRTGCDLLLPGDRRPLELAPDLLGWPGAHARLALIEGGPQAPAPSFGARRSSAAVYYVAAQPTRLPTRLLRSGALAVLVLPKELPVPARRPAAFEVSGCRGYLLAGVAQAEERAA